MESNIEYIHLFMEYESDDMPMVYFYEVDLNNDRLALLYANMHFTEEL